MRNLSTEEMYENGKKALKSEIYNEAEQWFLSVLYDYYISPKMNSELMDAQFQLEQIYIQDLAVNKKREEAFLLIFCFSDKHWHDLWCKNDLKGQGLFQWDGDFKFEDNLEDGINKFFLNEEFRPTIDIVTNTDKPLEKPEKTREELLGDDIAYQIRSLNKIYEGATLAPVFHRNTKYCINDLEKSIPYISYDDIMAYKYIIRGRNTDEEFNNFDSKERQVIVEYKSIEDLAKDGWRLD